MKRLKLVALATLLVCWPAAARADSPIMEFIEGWSGPGPFKVYYTGIDLRVVCLPNDRAKIGPDKDTIADQYFWNCYRDDDTRLKGRFMFNFNTGSNGGTTQLFSDDLLDNRNVDQKTIEIVYMHQLSSIVQVGGGIQWVRLSGDAAAASPATPTAPAQHAVDAFSFWRTGFPIRITFTPLGYLRLPGRKQGLSRLVQLTFESAYFGSTTKAENFGNHVSKFSASKEFQGRVVLGLDAAPLIAALKPHR